MLDTGITSEFLPMGDEARRLGCPIERLLVRTEPAMLSIAFPPPLSHASTSDPQGLNGSR
jgi:hypothetical protein